MTIYLSIVARWFLRLFYYRVQLVTGLILVGLPVIAANEEWGGNMVRGIFDIDTAMSLFWAGLLAMLLTYGMRLSARLVRLYGPERFDFKAKGLEGSRKTGVPDWLRDTSWMVLGAVPVLTLAYYRSVESGFWPGRDEGLPGFYALLVLLLGVVSATVLHMLAGGLAGQTDSVKEVIPLSPLEVLLLKMVMSLVKKVTRNEARNDPGPQVELAKKLVQILNWPSKFIPASLQKGFYEPQAGGGVQIKHGHVVLTAFTVFSMALLAVVGALEPSTVAPLVSLMALLLAGCLALSGIAFFFDRLPFPLLVLAGGWIFGVSLIWRQPHVIERHVVTDYQPVPGSEVMGVEANDPVTEYPIVIAAEGGGIHAGLWTAHVLEELIGEDKNFQLTDEKGNPLLGEDGKPMNAGREFLRRVRCVSGVSGGSYGLMYFVHAMASGDYDTTSTSLSRAAGKSSLGAVVHGLVFKDILSGILPYYSRGEDRGFTMEKSWEAASPNLKGLLLSDWASAVRERRCPAVLFNATSVERGTPLVFGNTTFESAPKQVQDWLYAAGGGYSIPVVSAARASATFPFVTPAVLVENGPLKEHAVDGGYYDNYGMAVLSRWLYGALDKLARSEDSDDSAAAKRKAPRQVLVIQIRSASAPTAEGNTWDRNPDVAPSLLPEAMEDGIMSELAAPLKALLNVRVAGQRQHNEDDFERMTQLLRCTERLGQERSKGLLEAWRELGKREAAKVAPKIKIENAVFAYRGNPPLSWHLTEKEKREVLGVKLTEWHPENLKCVREYLLKATRAAVEKRK